MIGKTLQAILNERGMNVNELAKLIGVSNQTLYSIIKRDNMKIDFEVLLKICKVLGVSVERFYTDYTSSAANGSCILSEHEMRLVAAYRNKPEMQPSVDKLLDIAPTTDVAADMANTLSATPQIPSFAKQK